MPEEVDGLNRLVLVLEEFRKLDPEMTVNAILAFVNVAHEPGIRQAKLEELQKMSQSGMSRAIAGLSQWQGFNRPGLELVEAQPNPQDRRHKIVTLTSKGEKLAGKLRKLIKGGPDVSR